MKIKISLLSYTQITSNSRVWPHKQPLIRYFEVTWVYVRLVSPEMPLFGVRP